MQAVNRKQSTPKPSTSTSRSTPRNTKSQVSHAANDLLTESKKLASAWYEDGLTKLNGAEKQIQTYSKKTAKKVQENPMTSLLIAGGIGFILSRLFMK